ncbi:uncharacterized protein (TIGR04222 family) [Actinocorallia herbida]|uniref:Uncharacterized protein (TIGR04222 family) n=2 Tax=Actinocorallia herbida TaxID=58109 RepID=A0A3N1CT51_9ACTN|nr:uncharacterized protein (TIGR04222 family) [Actinocorallia herbida]
MPPAGIETGECPMVLAETGSEATWGIEGPAFLALYVLLAALAVALVVALRRGPAAGVSMPGDLTPPELALLAGGDHRAVAASLAGLRLAGAVASAPGGKVLTTGPAPAGAAPLDHAVLYAAGAGIRSGDLVRQPAVAHELAAVRAALIARGQLLGPAARNSIRLRALLLVPVLLLGAARVAAGIGAERPVGLIAAVLVVLAVVTAVMLARAPERARAADHTVAIARQRLEGLHPTNAPSYADHGSSAAALAVAVFGGAALIGMDPAFAAEADLRTQLHQYSATSASSGGSSDSSGSSCSGGSSCGGSGGCGGGCGGCGG